MLLFFFPKALDPAADPVCSELQHYLKMADEESFADMDHVFPTGLLIPLPTNSG